MDAVLTDAEVLAQDRGVWGATPWDYSSCRFLKFNSNGTGELIYGYGQTIYAAIQCHWVIASVGFLQLSYLESPPRQRFQKAFSPSTENSAKTLEYKLTQGDVSGVESIIAQRYKFLWTLELSASPWPVGLDLPHEVPRVFYGQRQPNAAPGSLPPQ